MIKIMLICNGKFTKKNPFNRAFLHGRKGLCMSYKEFIENLQGNRKPHWGSDDSVS